MKNYNIFSELVKIQMIKNRINQKDLAKLLNISPQATGEKINNDNITLKSMQQIAEALNCKLKIELIPESEQNTNTESEEKEIETDLKKKLKSLKPLDI